MTPLPQPPNWRTRPVLITFALLIFVGGGGYHAYKTVAVLRRHDYLAATITIGLTVFYLAALLAVVVGKPRSKALRGKLGFHRHNTAA